MLRCIRNNTPCLPRRWVDFVLRHPLSVVLFAGFVSVILLWFTMANFRINTDFSSMIASDLPFRREEIKFQKAFPDLKNNLVLIIDAPTPETARYGQEVLAKRLEATKGLFRSIYIPGGGRFFRKNGLLYLSVQKLENLSDNLAQVQPFLGMLPEKLTMPSFFTMLADLIRQGGDKLLKDDRLLSLFANLGEAMDDAAQGRPHQISWDETMLGQKNSEAKSREFIILQPVLHYTSLYPAQQSIDTIRRLEATVGSEPELAGVRLSLTGNVALRQADLKSVQSGTEIAAVLSFVMVAVFLIMGLRSGWLVGASLFILTMGLVWTMGFAIGAIGSLNLISIAFVVLFIGMGVDYSIQICLRFRELFAAGLDRIEAIREATAEVGNPLLLCTITTAIGFYAFVPTAYAGASELGIISGTGIFLFLFVNLTVLPALLCLLPIKKPPAKTSHHGIPFHRWSRRYGRWVLVVAGLLTIASIYLAPRVSFDYNPLSLSNPQAKAVIAAKELFASSRTSPWTATVLRHSLEQAEKTASRLEKLPEVESALTIASFVPSHQEEKRSIIQDISLFMPPLPGPPDLRSVDVKSSYIALAGLNHTLKKSEEQAGSSLPPEMQKLAAASSRLINLGDRDRATAMSLLKRGVLFNLGLTLDHLEGMLQPGTVSLADLPSGLVSQYDSREGLYRIQVFPRKDLAEIKNLREFVAAIRTITPEVTDTPVSVLETGNAIIGSFKRAAIYALVLITILLLVVLRNRTETIFILIPLLLAVLYTGAASVIFGIPLNYANVIVIPLLLGVGIDYGIHLIFRHRITLPGDRHLLETSTARAVLFSALTTILSFSSLCFSGHRGTASMGILLTICTLLMIFCNLTILPAILDVYSTIRRRRAEDADNRP
ncbi:MAG: MMPL family transporter [Deltaproteobacteria bacterium]